MSVLSPKEVVDLYRKRAKNYDLTANLYYLIGFRLHHYRVLTIDSLDIKKGDTVLELGCGTGLNFPLLQQKIGKEGKIIGVDITDKMLEKAKERVKKNDWKNVEFFHDDVAQYNIPEGVDAVFSTFALTLSPDYDKVIKNCSESLRKGGRIAILDFKMPNNYMRFLAPLMILVTRPFGVRKELQYRHLWESVERYFQKSSLREMYGGFVYLSVGIKD
ncbi:arsenite S-adenosylmethyltransferase [Methanosarcina horonobensis HB-1 = JCM 15518]|uniref:Arsenite S-adenosylmethyltransferase n=1 Tax=Methanosarcina horonobensis HB-1 = JCM 15518 TaxID=1434110 RepID=A0A0E3SGJ6_9EURY|nr:class I SAM-dependent methyltransferase [Methanosarcina horonobensis]AKB79492.1 arsenite S-adenosylmethyltransferase [Methanosarcina horonobensis HB-1 = JCM 15518]